jgi:D-glycero-D-manno-heptose 1,7-bisphosphate phosphatase
MGKFHPSSAVSADPAPRAWPIEPPGVWLAVAAPRAAAPRAALFLDRDGVVIEDRHFVSDPEDVALVPGAGELIAAANRAGTPACVASNQSGIDRGLFGWAEFAAVEAEIAARLAREGARLDGVAACPFHPDFTPGYDARLAEWRKPGAAMISALAERLNLDLARSWLVGDRARDAEAAKRAGLAGAVVMPAEAAERDAAERLAEPGFALHVVASLGEARDFLRRGGLVA